MSRGMKREAAFAGQFYPASMESLEGQIRAFTEAEVAREEVAGAVVPHAGYIYSGKVAGAVYARITLPRLFVIIGPNHTGKGYPFSLMSDGIWKTPSGEVAIDAELAEKILANSKNLKADDKAHMYEHSIEVQLPFLQYYTKKFCFVPIILAHGDFATYYEIGCAIASAVKGGEKVLIIASSDLSHYEPREVARRKDSRVIDAILSLDGERLLKTVKDLEVSMCGYGPVVTMLSAAKALGATEAELIQYATSDETSGDSSTVVGYTGIIVK
ncbi:AmmeMemoRadiSam system protein B [candidate division NPL-UPA2 bacterium Unc8]|uniref:MEMO1 family protein B9J77_02975 n=1 Tax=candidate division NPL-UPA2 bacterium Unc8 TaxID=1980939 RepID=A0A399FV49_UNCN2|nr:MAG: AmmeMemoRadiSam system protein B [candidate division NPL-UPA2 bacterium Unc8]